MRIKGLSALLVAALAIGIAASQALAATTWTVDQTTGTDLCAGNICKTISEAVAAASAGDTINVHDGTYTENVLIDKSLTLKGGTRKTLATGCGAAVSSPTYDSIVVAAGAQPYAFDIEADNVSVSGFVFQNPAPGKWGVVVDLLTQNAAYSGFTFTYNVFEQMAANTTALFLSSNGTNPTLVQQNCFRQNAEDAIFAGWGGADTLKDVTVIANKFVDNAYGDVIFANPDQEKLKIQGNIVTRGGVFVVLINASDFTIQGNIVKNQNTAGVAEHASIFLGGSNSNGTISGNILKDGTHRGIVFDKAYTGVANTDLTVASNIVTGFAGHAVQALAASLTNSTITGNVFKSTGGNGLFFGNNSTGNNLSGNIANGSTFGCRALGSAVGGNTWNGSSNIGKPANTGGTCWP